MKPHSDSIIKHTYLVTLIVKMVYFTKKSRNSGIYNHISILLLIAWKHLHW